MSGTRRVPGRVFAAVAAAVVVSVLVAARPASPAGRPLARASHLVVVGLPTLTFDDLRTGALPHLRALAGTGAVGAMTARLANRTPTSADLYAAMGAGSEAATPSGFGSTEAAGPSSIVMRGAAEAVRRNRDAHRSSLPGALGDALARAGDGAAAVGNADAPGVGAGSVDRDNYRPVAATVMTSDGRVPAAVVERSALLRSDPAAPEGLAADPSLVAGRTLDALAANRVVVVDLGDLDRLASVDPAPSPEQNARLRTAALQRADETIGRLRTGAPDGTLLVVAGLDAGAARRLTPVVVAGPGVVPGYLVSPSTGRRGILTIADLAPTVLHSLRDPVPAEMVGQPLRSSASTATATTRLDRLATLDRDARAVERLRRPVTQAAAIGVTVFALFALLVLSPLGRPDRSGPPLRAAALATSSLPLAVLLAGFLPVGGARSWSPVVVAAAVVVVPVVARAGTTSWRAAFLAVQAATLALLLVDVCTGSRLQTSTALGSSLLVAARFRGLGNAGLGTAAAATILLASALVAYRAALRPWVVVLFAVVTVAVCVPFLGAKVGGIFVLVPVFVGLGWVLFGRRLSWRVIAAAGAAVVVVLGLAVAVDGLFPGRTRSHLGRLAGTTARTGGDSLAVVIARKLGSGVHVARTSQWMPATVALVVVAVAVLVLWGGWREVTPPGSVERTTAVALIAAAVLGLLTSDSGILTAALVLVAAVPWLVLVRLGPAEDRDRAGQ